MVPFIPLASPTRLGTNLGIKEITDVHQSFTVLVAVVSILRWPVAGPVACRGATSLAFEFSRYPSNRTLLRRAMSHTLDKRGAPIEERWALAALAVALLRTPTLEVTSLTPELSRKTTRAVNH
jgi:hypothetical protein